MGARGSNLEVEVKLRLANAGEGRRALRRAGFRVSRRRVFESNVVYDTPDSALRGQGKLLRVRQAGRKTTLTYKGPAAAGKHKSREELELELPGGNVFEEILKRLGMAPLFRYEKYRTEYEQPQASGTATLDETPIGDFLELEGPPEWIDSTAGSLGYGEGAYITASYGRLYIEYRESRSDAPADMVFTKKGGL